MFQCQFKSIRNFLIIYHFAFFKLLHGNFNKNKSTTFKAYTTVHIFIYLMFLLYERSNDLYEKEILTVYKYDWSGMTSRLNTNEIQL
jgi:hypothetical protein